MTRPNLGHAIRTAPRILDVAALAAEHATAPARVAAQAREHDRNACRCEECDGRGARGVNEDGDGYPCGDCDATGLYAPGRAHVLLEHGVYTCGPCGFDLCGDEDQCPSCGVLYLEDLAELLRISTATAANEEAA